MGDYLKKLGPRVTLSVPTSDYDALNMLANNNDVSISWVVRRAIHEYLRRQDQPIQRLKRPRPEKRPNLSERT
jgi:hypothetical protein